MIEEEVGQVEGQAAAAVEANEDNINQNVCSAAPTTGPVAQMMTSATRPVTTTRFGHASKPPNHLINEVRAATIKN